VSNAHAGSRRTRLVAIALGAVPALCLAAGSSSFAPRIKSVHELIVEGDRPEISACLYAAQLNVSQSHEFERIRWSDRISDESVVRETQAAGQLVRVTTFEASALTEGTGLLSRGHWVDVQVECQQVNEKAPVVTLSRKPEKATH
jgi:hypothetical protein